MLLILNLIYGRSNKRLYLDIFNNSANIDPPAYYYVLAVRTFFLPSPVHSLRHSPLINTD